MAATNLRDLVADWYVRLTGGLVMRRLRGGRADSERSATRATVPANAS